MDLNYVLRNAIETVADFSIHSRLSILPYIYIYYLHSFECIASSHAIETVYWKILKYLQSRLYYGDRQFVKLQKNFLNNNLIADWNVLPDEKFGVNIFASTCVVY